MKKNLLQICSLFTVLSALAVLSSCSSSENTVVINDAPVSAAQPDTTQQAEPAGSFKQLTIGENQKIRTLDPLFVENDSELRAIQLLYEGLVRYDKNGKIIPAVASNWSVSDNQQTYRFTLKDGLFYHDSDIFNNGRGRRLVAADVKQDFERMAKATVPERAAHFFMNIQGFEPYYQEQHHVMRTSDREFSGVRGIKVPNDTTVVFSLVKPDNQFLQKLAIPYAVIYPLESLTDDGFKAVGTGPFKLSQQRSDSLYIFARFDNYHASGQPKIDRINIVTSSNETSLLNALTRDEIQIIPELGPQQMQMASNAEGQLKKTVSSSYQLVTFPKSPTYRLQYNSGADVPKESVEQALSSLSNASFFSELPAATVQLNWKLSAPDAASKPDSLASSYAGDPVILLFYTTLSRQLEAQGIAFHKKSTRVANRNTALFTTKSFPFFEGDQVEGLDLNNTLATFTVKSWALVKTRINNSLFNDFSWWIDLRNVTVPLKSL